MIIVDMNAFENFKNKPQQAEPREAVQGAVTGPRKGWQIYWQPWRAGLEGKHEPLEKILQKGGNNKGCPLSAELPAVTAVPSPSAMALRCGGH